MEIVPSWDCRAASCMKRTIFDLMLPRGAVQREVKSRRFVQTWTGEAYACPVLACTFPNCGFGKGSVIDEGSIWQGDRLPGSDGILKLCLNYESDRNIKGIDENGADDARLKE